ncbi:MAG TPA: LemA family protein [Candidatus Nanoarchaeia archaeon]|nr:LemA family protein [Candidatus Nanoarchaeia archaeon]
MVSWTVIGIIIAVLVVLVIILYNSIIRLKLQVKNALAQIDVQLKRRNDLIPNLVETVKGYMKHEKRVLETTTKARSAMLSAKTMKEKASASNMISDTLKTLFAVSENYPQLKANENFLQLQEELAGTENKISYARQHYNDIVMEYNTKIKVFPNTLFAKWFKFTDELMFEAAKEERKQVKVKF